MLTKFNPSADIILVNAPQFTPRYLPVGLGYVTEAVKNCGFTPTVLDINNIIINRYSCYNIGPYWSGGDLGRDQTYWWCGDGFSEIWKIFGKDFMEFVDILASSKSPLIGFSINMMSRLASEKLATEVKTRNPDKIILYGGHECKSYELCHDFSEAPDYIFVGESEESLPEFLKSYFAGNAQISVPGVISTRSTVNNFISRNPPDDLDALSWPKWEEFNLFSYTTVEANLTMTIDESRGCTWAKCAFCSDCKVTPGYRRRSNESLFAEIRYFVEHHDIRGFHFSCLLLNGNHDELEKLCDLIISHNLNISFSGQFRIDKRLSPILLKKLQLAGLANINFGVETGSGRLMKLMRKGMNVAMVEQCLRDAKEAGLVTNINLMVGFPGETEEDINELLEFLNRNIEFLDIIEVVNVFSVQHSSDVWADPEQYECLFTMPPGSREDRNWISIDQQNDLPERTRRGLVVAEKIKELDLKFGATSQPLVFHGKDTSHYNPVLYTQALTHYLKNTISHDTNNKILLVRSCPVQQFKLFTDCVVQNLVDSEIHLLCQNGIDEQINKHFKNLRKFWCDDGPLSEKSLSDNTIGALKEEKYDAVLIPLGGMELSTYLHVFQLASILAPESLVYDIDGKKADIRLIENICVYRNQSKCKN